MSPSEFESMAGVPAKKWKQSIKYGDKPLGVWLAHNPPFEALSGASQSDCQMSNNDLDNTATDQNSISDCPATISVDPEPDTMATSTQFRQIPCSHNEVTKSSHTLQTDPQNTAVDHRESISEYSNSVSEGTLASQGYAMKVDVIFKELEEKLTTSLKQLIDAAFDTVKIQLSNEMQQIMLKVDHLSAQVAQLEERMLVTDMADASDLLPSTVDHPSTVTKSYEDAASIKIQIEQLQKALEMNEREKKKKNIVIVGLPEKEGSCESQIEDLIKEKLKLNLKDTKISQARRMGRKNTQRPSPRLVLVTFESVSSKQLVMRNRRKLAGTAIHINNDLTRDQRILEKNLREKKKFLTNHCSYKEKKITIYKGKLWADRQYISTCSPLITPNRD